MAVQMAEDQDTVPLIKRFLPRTLLGRSLLIIVSPLVLVQVIATWVFFDRHYDTTTKRLAEGVAGDIAMVIRMMGESATIKRQTRVIRLANTAMALDVTVDPDNQLPEALPGPGWGVLEQKLDAALRKRLPR
jgi:two-component system osmolarity sensor histidine kinase EnvZ